jgi:hypothetical protein
MVIWRFGQRRTRKLWLRYCRAAHPDPADEDHAAKYHTLLWDFSPPPSDRLSIGHFVPGKFQKMDQWINAIEVHSADERVSRFESFSRSGEGIRVATNVGKVSTMSHRDRRISKDGKLRYILMSLFLGTLRHDDPSNYLQKSRVTSEDKTHFWSNTLIYAWCLDSVRICRLNLPQHQEEYKIVISWPSRTVEIYFCR